MNKVILIGNLTRDVELKTIASGKPVATCGIATSRKYKTETGEVKEATQFHNLVIWGKSAETFAKYLSKGKKVMIEGELQHRQYDKKDGSGKGYATEINVREFEFLTPRGTSAPAPAAAASASSDDGRNDAAYNAAYAAGMTGEPAEEEIRVEDIPF